MLVQCTVRSVFIEIHTNTVYSKDFHSRESAKSTVNKINEMEKENIKSTTYLFNDIVFMCLQGSREYALGR